MSAYDHHMKKALEWLEVAESAAEMLRVETPSGTTFATMGITDRMAMSLAASKIAEVHIKMAEVIA